MSMPAYMYGIARAGSMAQRAFPTTGQPPARGWLPGRTGTGGVRIDIAIDEFKMAQQGCQSVNDVIINVLVLCDGFVMTLLHSANYASAYDVRTGNFIALVSLHCQ